tara:strand:+ start:2177 stop:2386 length:210 start_codon:yes stop_codon:yes gene_type:complete
MDVAFAVMGILVVLSIIFAVICMLIASIALDNRDFNRFHKFDGLVKLSFANSAIVFLLMAIVGIILDIK